MRNTVDRHVLLCFNTQPPKGGWFRRRVGQYHKFVSTHSRLKAAGFRRRVGQYHKFVSTHSRLKAAGCFPCTFIFFIQVSTHSRLKAAGQLYRVFCRVVRRFNTQPPKGGWGLWFILL